MRNNETGEFEMVMGNKQLLSGFFVVVILFGVFFTMGYIVGRNSAPAGRPGETPAASSQPAAAAPQQASAMPPAAAEAPKPADGQPAEGPQPTTQPAQDSAAQPPAQTAAQPPAQPAAQPPEQAAAEVVARTLREKGLPATMSPGPKDLLRVLVGPYNDAAALGQAKTKLQNAGFDA